MQKNDVYKNGYSRRSCTFKTAKIYHFVRFVMYCSITTLPVAFCWARSDDTVHYKYDKMVISLPKWHIHTRNDVIWLTDLKTGAGVKKEQQN